LTLSTTSTASRAFRSVIGASVAVAVREAAAIGAATVVVRKLRRPMPLPMGKRDESMSRFLLLSKRYER
jgi:hypothetical protein